jgi:hypothetical protein
MNLHSDKICLFKNLIFILQFFIILINLFYFNNKTNSITNDSSILFD